MDDDTQAWHHQQQLEQQERIQLGIQSLEQDVEQMKNDPLFQEKDNVSKSN